jgi:predicted choloylglycine hydrolase
LILRYVLETCRDTAGALAALCRLPCHMCYTVGVVDRAGAIATVFLNPDRPAVVVDDPVATNHQRIVEWPAHAAITGTLERHATLECLIADTSETLESIVEHFGEPPLRAFDHARRFATLYTAVYQPARGQVELHWPTVSWRLSFNRFATQTIVVTL